MLRYGTFLLILVFPIGCTAALPTQKVMENEDIQGKWKIVEMREGDTRVTVKDFDGIVTFDKEKMVFESGNGKNGNESMEYKLNPSKKEIDIILEEAGRTLTLKGVYELDGDMLIFATGKPNGGRPKSAKMGKDINFYMFERVKEEKK